MAPTEPVPPLPDNPSNMEPFKTWKDCLRALESDASPLSDEKRLEFIIRIERSAEPKLIAFECLGWLRRGTEAKKFRWLEEPMNRLLGGGEQPPYLALLENPILVGKWVSEQLKPLDTLNAWKMFFASGRHLWLLHCLFQCRDKRGSLVEGLVALANGLAHWQNLQSPALWKKGGVQPTDPHWIAKLLEARVPAKLELPKGFAEAVYAVSAIADLSASSRSELQGMWRQLDATRRECDEEREARLAAAAKALDLEHELEQTRGELIRCRLELEAEKKHTVRTGGFSEVARKETIQQVLSDVRHGLSHRLEDIRTYADRENPNREEIIELVHEIQTHLTKLEQRLLP